MTRRDKMNPKLLSISLFKTLEFIESGGKRFPSFRQPFVNMQLDSLPSNCTIAMTFSFAPIELNRTYKLKIRFMDPDRTTIYETEGDLNISSNSTPIFNPNAMIVFESDDIHFSKEGNYNVGFELDGSLLGEHSFGVCKRVMDS